MTEEGTQKINAILEVLQAAVTGDVRSFEQFNAILSKAGLELAEYDELLRKAAEGEIQDSEAVKRLVEQLQLFTTEANAAKGALAG